MERFQAEIGSWGDREFRFGELSWGPYFGFSRSGVTFNNVMLPNPAEAEAHGEDVGNVVVWADGDDVDEKGIELGDEGGIELEGAVI